MRVCARVCVSEKEMSSIFTQSLHGMCRFDDHPWPRKMGGRLWISPNIQWEGARV